MPKKYLSLLGSTGSVGKSTLNVVRKSKNKFQIIALAGRVNIDLLEKQALEFKPKIVAVSEEKEAAALRKRLPPSIKVVSSVDGLIEVATLDEADLVVSAIGGTAGILPTFKALEAKKNVALANKETLVSAGPLVMDLVKKNQTTLLPLDSEHSAIFQCLKGEETKKIESLILTASGGPFRDYSKERLLEIKVEEALLHPTYSMGAKITVDSSTLMNKGLEIIEASYLFSVPLEKIDVVVHPQSIIHSMVRFIDGSILAQMSLPNMEIPIQYALSYPSREKFVMNFDFSQCSKLEFFLPDYDKFRCLYLAKEALKIGKSMPCYINGANEILVERFLKKEIQWNEIATKLEKLMSSHKIQNLLNLEDVLDVDKKAKAEAKKI